MASGEMIPVKFCVRWQEDVESYAGRSLSLGRPFDYAALRVLERTGGVKNILFPNSAYSFD